MAIIRIAVTALLTALAFSAVAARDLIGAKLMSMELARDIASHALLACRDKGHQVSVVVVDRGGSVQVALRDVYASRFTLEIAERKANAVILSGVPSGDLRQNRADIRQELNHVKGILVLDGALPIRSGGSLLGAVGVSGAPGGHLDAECAKKGLAAVKDRLAFGE
jgi:uncharacterized protein GlcG (DUF336 family)